MTSVIYYIVKCNGLISHLARLKFSVEINKYLGEKIAHQILDTEIRYNHREKKKLLQKFKTNTNSLRNTIELIIEIFLHRQIKLIIKKQEEK